MASGVLKMDSKKIISKIEERKKDIKGYGVKKIGLFGSFIKGKQHKQSDIDILVTFEDISFDSYTELKWMLEKLLGKKIDLVIEKDLRPELNYVKKEAKYVKL